MSLTETLNKRFDVVVNSLTEKDFYLNCYYYFDYIYEHPELLKIYEDAYVTYTRKFGDIWADWNDKRREYLDSGRTIEPPEITTQPEEVSRLEKFDMYCNACGLDVRVYQPIKHYKECEHELCGDYNGSLLLNGLDFTLKRYKKDYRNLNKQISSTYKHWYEGQREHYQAELSRFHIEFIEEVGKLSLVEVPHTTEIKPFLNLNTGDFMYFGKQGNFPISGQDFKILRILQDSIDKPVPYLKLIQAIIPSVTEVREVHKMALRDVIKNIKRKLGVLPKGSASKPDPIKMVRQHGYRLEIPHK